MKVVILEDIAEVSAGQGAPQGDYSYGDEGLPFIKAGNLENLIVTSDEYKSCKLVSSKIAKQYKLKSYPKDTLVFAKSGMSAMKGRIYLLNNEAYVVNHLATITSNTKFVDPKYLRYFFYVFAPSRLIKDEAYPSIGLADIKKIKIPLPSLEDQKRIVRILDKADELYQKRKQVNKLLDEYIDAIFFNMFVVNSEEKNINFVKLEDITLKVTDGVHAKPKYTGSGIPFISVKNITTTKLKFDDCKFVSLEDHRKFTNRCRAEFGDILYTKVGATYGRACVVDTEKEFSLYVSVALIKPQKELVNSTFLKAMLNSSFIKRQADKSVKGAGVPDLHLIEIKKFKVPLPDIKDQEKFADLVLKVEEIKRKMSVQSKELETQFQALMQKAFNGEL